MDDYRKDAKVKKAESILSISKVIFGISVAILIITGLVLVVVSLASTNNSGVFNWQALVSGLSMFVGIIFAWMFKQFLDGFALIVYDSAIHLHDRGIVTSVDIEDEHQQNNKANQ